MRGWERKKKNNQGCCKIAEFMYQIEGIHLLQEEVVGAEVSSTPAAAAPASVFLAWHVIQDQSKKLEEKGTEHGSVLPIHDSTHMNTL